MTQYTNQQYTTIIIILQCVEKQPEDKKSLIEFQIKFNRFIEYLKLFPYDYERKRL